MNRGALEPKVYPQMAGKPWEIWDEGASLDDAWLTFARAKTKADYAATFDLPKEDHRTPEASLGTVLRALSRLSGHRPEEKQREELRQMMRSDLLDWLLCEVFYGFGFPVRPHRDRTPRRISSEFWENPDINWEKGIASDVDSEFQRIRIVDPRDFPEIELKPKIGRKTHKPAIYRAMGKIIKAYPDFGQWLGGQQIQLVLEFMEKENPNLKGERNGLEDRAIKNHIRTYLEKRNIK